MLIIEDENTSAYISFYHKNQLFAIHNSRDVMEVAYNRDGTVVHRQILGELR